jgi:hypothetical protein
MNCCSCGAAMAALTLDGHMGTRVEIDLCSACQVIWFDHLEDVRLAPAGTLNLFRAIGDRGQAVPPQLKEPLRCPRCDLRLLPTHDRQRNTPFFYWRCPREHGRLITFLDFLREKDFIRPLSPQQLAELRQNVQTINCSNCGAPIDLVHASVCEHCGTPVSMLDVKQIQQMTARLTQPDSAPAKDATAQAPEHGLIGQLPPIWVAEHSSGGGKEVAALFEALRADNAWDRSSSFGLVEAGLWMVSKLLS